MGKKWEENGVQVSTKSREEKIGDRFRAQLIVFTTRNSFNLQRIYLQREPYIVKFYPQTLRSAMDTFPAKASPLPILVLYRISNSLDKSQSCTDSRLNAFYVPSTPSDPSGKRGGLLMSDVFSHAPHFIVPSEYHWRLRVNGAKRGEYEFWDVRDYGRTLPVTEFVTNNPEDQKVMESYFGSDNLSRGFINDADVGSDGAGGKGKRRGLMSKLKLSASSSSSSATHLPQVGQSTLLRVMSFNLLAVNPDLGPSLLSTPPKARFATRSAYVPPMRPVTNPATTARKTNKTFASSSVQRQKVDTPSLDHNVDLFNDTVSQPPTIARAEGSGGGAPSREESLKSFYNFQKTRQNRRWDEIEQRWVVTDDDVGKPACGQAGRKKSRSSETGAAAPRTLSNTKLAVESRLKRESETKSKQKEAVDNLRKRNEKAALEEKSTDLARIKLEEILTAWSTEYGKKKSLSALLASLHTVLWPGTKWKPISLADLMTKQQRRKGYLKASLLVHPDKTKDLGPEERFRATRIFDAVAQAWKLENEEEGGD